MRNDSPVLVQEPAPRAAATSIAPLLLAFASVLAPLLLFGALAEDVWTREAFRWDSPTLRWLHAHASPGLDTLMLRATLIGGTSGMLPLAALVGLGLWLSGHRREARFGLAGVGGVCVIVLVTKSVFQRARPDLWLSLAPEHDYGFPSGHAMLSSAVVGVLLFLLWRSRAGRSLQVLGTVAGVAFVLLVGASRLYLGVHFPSDVLAGWAASLAWVSGAYQLLLGSAWGARTALGRAGLKRKPHVL